MISDHRLLILEIVENDKLKLDRMKEVVEPYMIAMSKNKDIRDKLINIFKSDIYEVGLLRLIHDNTYNFKTKKKKNILFKLYKKYSFKNKKTA